MHIGAHDARPSALHRHYLPVHLNRSDFLSTATYVQKVVHPHNEYKHDRRPALSAALRFSQQSAVPVRVNILRKLAGSVSLYWQLALLLVGHFAQ